jgi:hypothetical protein
MTNVTNQANKQRTSQFSNLDWVLDDAGQIKIVIADDAKAAVAPDDLNYLNEDIAKLRSFESGADDHWLTDDVEMGVVRKPLFLESTYISDVAMAILAEHGYEFSWIAQQALMLNHAHMFGIKRTTMILLAKTLKKEKGRWIQNYATFATDEMIEARPLKSLPKSHIDDIWVWRMDDNGEEHYEVYPELLQKAKYSDITEEQEYNVMQYITDSDIFQSLFGEGATMRMVSGFTALHGKHRYAMVMPEVSLERATGKFVHDRTGKLASTLHANASPGTSQQSIWDARETIKIGFPRFLDKAKPNTSDVEWRKLWDGATKS